MSVQIQDGIGVSLRTGALMMANGVASYGGDGKPCTFAPLTTNYDAAAYSKWGDNNCLPLEMANHIENCGVLSAAIDGKSRIAIGKGPQWFLLTNIDQDGKEELEYVPDAELQDWIEDNNVFDFSMDLSYDVNGYGWNTGSMILNARRDYINRIRRIDVVTARLQKMNSAGVINSVYLCNDWLQAPAIFDKNKMAQIPALQEGYEFRDLSARSSGFEFAFINRRQRNGRTYYPMPLWWAARAWVKVARSVPAFKNAMFTNQIQLKYIISISEKYWPSVYGEEWDDWDQPTREAKVQEKYDEIETWLTGEDKAYKTLISGTFYDQVKGTETPFIKVDVIDDKIADGKLLPESSAANSEMLFAVMMNPALMGAGQPGGPYAANAGGSNVRESYLVQLMIMEAERRMNTRIFNTVKRFNGWSKRFEVERTVMAVTAPAAVPGIAAAKPSDKKITPRLVLRYPSGLLTTLDTGGSMKGEVV